LPASITSKRSTPGRMSLRKVPRPLLHTSSNRGLDFTAFQGLVGGQPSLGLDELILAKAESDDVFGGGVLHRKPLNWTEHGAQFLYRARRQVDPQDSGIVIPEHHAIAPFIAYY